MRPNHLCGEYYCSAYPFEERILIFLLYLAVTTSSRRRSEKPIQLSGVFLKCKTVGIPFRPNGRSTVRHCFAWLHPFLRSSSNSLHPSQASLWFHSSRSCDHKASANNQSGSISHGLYKSSASRVQTSIAEGQHLLASS